MDKPIPPLPSPYPYFDPTSQQHIPIPSYMKLPNDPFAFMESCVSKSLLSATIGGVSGIGMGILLGSWSAISPPITLPGVPDPPKIPIKWQMREMALFTARRGTRWGRNFMFLGGTYAGIECCIEKFRAKHDIINPVAGGCATGAVLASSQGPMGMCLGCAGFALFSYGIEKLMGTH
jgi:import inner membrane translocase subunit TIM22